MQNPTPVTETSAAWRTVTEMGHGFVAMLPRLAVGLVVFLLFWAVAAATTCCGASTTWASATETT